MATLHFLNNSHEDLISLIDSILLIFNPGFVEVMYIFKSLVELYNPVDHHEWVWILSSTHITVWPWHVVSIILTPNIVIVTC